MGRERAVQARKSEPGNRRALSVARYSYGAGHFSNICSERPERAAAISSDAEAQIDSPRGEGDSLPESARHFFDPRFGFDFSRVRVHTDSRAAEAGHAASTLTLRRPSSAGPNEKRDAPVKPLKKPVMGRADNEDAVEREADRIADAVLGNRPIALGRDFGSIAVDAGTLSRKNCGGSCTCAKCSGGEDEVIHRRSAGGIAGPAVPVGVGEVIASPGTPLTSPARGFFESRFGVSFADVRIHSDGKAGESAKEIDARAYTVGNHIVFGRGEYNPASSSGRWLLAHELAHVVQASDGIIRRKGKTAGDVPKLEFEPAVNQPPCACVVFVHNEERKARKTARLLHTNCRYNLAMVQDPDALKARTIQVPKHADPVDPNSLFPADVIDACMGDEKACRDFLADKKTSTKPDEILGFAQRQYFLAVKDCSNGFKLPVVGLHNNALNDTATYRGNMGSKGVADLKLNVDKGGKTTGPDVLDTIRKRIKDKFGGAGEKETLDTPKTTNIYRWCKSDDIERCHIGNPEHPDNVVWVTNAADFDKLKTTNANVVFESQRPKPATSESAGDLSTMFVLLGLRLADQWSTQASIAKGIIEERVLDAVSDTLRPFLLLDPKPEDADAKTKKDKALSAALAAMDQLGGEFKNLRFANIETEGKGWGKESERVANYRAIVAVLTDLGIHCCDVEGKGDAGVEAGLKGADD